MRKKEFTSGLRNQERMVRLPGIRHHALKRPKPGNNQQRDDECKNVKREADFPIVAEFVITNALNDEVGLVTDGG